MAVNRGKSPILPHVEHRMSIVATLVAAKMTQRQIVSALGEQGIVNPETQEPYGLTTIHKDIQALKKEWRKRSETETSEWIAEETASLDELERKAWVTKDYDLVLRVKARRAKMLGLDAAIKQDITVDVKKLSDDELAKLAEGQKP